MFDGQLRAAREGKGLTREAVATMAGCSLDAVKRLENGRGSVETLVAVMRTVELRLIGIASGATLPDQLRTRRGKRSLSEVAELAGIDRVTLRRIEEGKGSVGPLMKVVAAIAPKARVAEPVRAHWNHDHSGERDRRFTPPWFLEAVEQSFGPISLDPCYDPASFVRAEKTISLSDGGNGLVDRWEGKLAFVNPPYSALVRWFTRAADAYERGEVEKIVMLCPARVDSPVFNERIIGKASVGMIGHRLRFHDPEGTLLPPTPFSMMVVLWGASSEEIDSLDGRIKLNWMR